MENRMAIGLIVGAIITIGSIIYNSSKFSAAQKMFLIPSLIFAPVGIPLILVVLFYNQSKIGKDKNQQVKLNTSKPILEKDNSLNKVEKKVIISNEINSPAPEFESSLEELDQKINLLISAFKNGILSEREFQEKKNHLELEKEKLSNSNIRKQNVQNLIQRNKRAFDELDELRNSGLITNVEYLEKRETLISRFEESEIEEFLNYADLNRDKNLSSEVVASEQKTDSKIEQPASDKEVRTSFKRLVIVLLILSIVIAGIYLLKPILYGKNGQSINYDYSNTQTQTKENTKDLKERDKEVSINNDNTENLKQEETINKPSLTETQNWLVSKFKLYLINEISYFSSNSSTNYYEVENHNLKYLNVHFDENYLVVKYNYKVDIINTDVQSRFIDSDQSISKEEWVNRHKVSKRTTRDDNISVYIPVELISRTFYSFHKNATGSHEFYIWTKDEDIIFKNETTGINKYTTAFTCKFDYPKDEKNLYNRIEAAFKFLKENTPKKSNNKKKEPF